MLPFDSCCFTQVLLCSYYHLTILYPWYEVYRGNIVFALSVIMCVCLSVCLSVNFFVKDFSATT